MTKYLRFNQKIVVESFKRQFCIHLTFYRYITHDQFMHDVVIQFDVVETVGKSYR